MPIRGTPGERAERLPWTIVNDREAAGICDRPRDDCRFARPQVPKRRPTTRRSPGCPARVTWINGDALTTGGSSKSDFPFQLFEVDAEDVDLSRRQLAEEIPA